jgi:Fe-S-cluster-containing dehydrogenase component
MRGEKMADPTSEARRRFLKELLACSGAGMLFIYKQPSLAKLLAGEKAVENVEHEYAFVVDVDKCIGCGKCVQACGFENDVPEGQYRTWVERYVITDDGGVYVDSPKGGSDGFTPVDEAIRSRVKRAFFVPKLCNHCENPPCVQVCPVGATFRTEEGFVLVDPKHCIGCSYCVQACPYGARFINKEAHTADKCTWCHHRVVAGKQPACVTVCPTQARLFGDLKDSKDPVARIFMDDRWNILKPEMHTRAMCLYIALPREVV